MSTEPENPPGPPPESAPPEVAPGAPESAAAPVAAGQKSEKKLVAGILAILLGWLGIHKFYLGYQKEGIILLLVGVLGGCLFGIGTIAASVIGIVEGVIYLTKSDDEFDRTYVTGRKPWF